MNAAYAMCDYEDARRALERLLRELMHLNPSAARSLEEGMDETLTIHRLALPELLRRSLASTNIIESFFFWRGGPLPASEALACWGSLATLGGLRVGQSGESLSAPQGPQGDASVVVGS